MVRTLTAYLKIQRQGPPVRDMPRHKLKMIKLLIIATEPIKTVKGRFQILPVRVLIMTHKTHLKVKHNDVSLSIIICLVSSAKTKTRFLELYWHPPWWPISGHSGISQSSL